MSDRHAYLRALIESGASHPPQPVRPTDRDSVLVEKLLAHRTAQVYAPACARWPEDSTELVHDLRVATRRLREALALAAPLIDPRTLKRVDRRAQKLGRTLGQRRMADVFLEDVRTLEAAGGEGGLSDFVAYLEARRDHATKRVHVRFPRERLLRHGLDLLVLTLRPTLDPRPLGGIAGPHLRKRAEVVEDRLGAIAEPSAIERHHRLRIALKHLRYAAEILTEPYPDLINPEENVLPLRNLQDALGDLNDAQELLALVRAHRKSLRHGGEAGVLDAFSRRLEMLARERYDSAKSLIGHRPPPVIGALRAIAGRLR